MSGVVHIAGNSVTINGRYLRQRCAWCGSVLLDYDLNGIGVQCTCNAAQQPGVVQHNKTCPASRPIGTWPAGSFIRVDGGCKSLEELDAVPPDSCAALDPAATA